MTLRIALTVGAAALTAACSWSSPEEGMTPAEPPASSRPNDPMSELSASQVFIEKGVRYMEQGHYDIALKDLKRAAELDDTNSEAFNALAVLYQRIDDFPNADASFRKALSLKEDNYAARNNYGRFLCSQGKHDEAFRQFETVIGTKLYTQSWIPLTNAGLCARTLGRRGEAETYLRRALEVQPDFPPALLEMARLSRENGQAMSARAFLQRYFSVAAPTPEALALGVEIETSLRNPEAAEDYVRRLRGQFPGSKEAVQVRRRYSE